MIVVPKTPITAAFLWIWLFTLKIAHCSCHRGNSKSKKWSQKHFNFSHLSVWSERWTQRYWFIGSWAKTQNSKERFHTCFKGRLNCFLKCWEPLKFSGKTTSIFSAGESSEMFQYSSLPLSNTKRYSSALKRGNSWERMLISWWCYCFLNALGLHVIGSTFVSYRISL